MLAVDIPCGVDGLTGRGARARRCAGRRTVTFAALKPGLLLEPGRSLAGEVEVADIGLDVAGARGRLVVEATTWRAGSRAAPADAHKWHAARAGGGRLARA